MLAEHLKFESYTTKERNKLIREFFKEKEFFTQVQIKQSNVWLTINPELTGREINDLLKYLNGHLTVVQCKRLLTDKDEEEWSEILMIQINKRLNKYMRPFLDERKKRESNKKLPEVLKDFLIL